MKRVAVCSGKGGTGKTIISLNMVHRLPNSALLDLDFTAPDVPVYLKGNIELGGERIHPTEVHGKKYFSIGYLGDDPMTWEGVGIKELVAELFKVVDWGELDYLLIDCPPGLTQENIALLDKIDTAIIVTTPSPSSYADGKKVVELFKDEGIPIAGEIRNMSYYCCPNCGAIHRIFQSSEDYLEIPFICEIPLVELQPGGIILDTDFPIDKILQAIENPLIPERKSHIKRELLKQLLRVKNVEKNT